MAHRRSSAFERLNRRAMEVEVEEDEDEKLCSIFDSAVLPATDPRHEPFAVRVDKWVYESKEPVSQSLPAGGFLTQRRSNNLYGQRPVEAPQIKAKFGNLN